MKYLSLLALLFLAACNKHTDSNQKSIVERLDPALDAIVAPDAQMEVIGSGYEWSEGALWVPTQQMLLFSDVPNNVVYKWTREKGIETYLKPSGYMGTDKYSNEPGSNGLVLDAEQNLVLCQQGERRMAMMQAPLDHPQPSFLALADNYNGKKFNSPNDACYDANGNLYFTDPPYGLPQQENSPIKELPFQGVYKMAPNGTVTLLLDSITRPNGIAVSPDNKYLYVANSDPGKAYWYRYELGDSTLVSGGIFYDAMPLTKTSNGVPDGMKIDKNGNILGAGPGGICIINPEGKLLGRIRFDSSISNCALADDDKTLFVTNDNQVVRIQLRK